MHRLLRCALPPWQGCSAAQCGGSSLRGHYSITKARRLLAHDRLAVTSQLTQCATLEMARGGSAPFEPQEARAAAECVGGGIALLCRRVLMADRRTVAASARVSPAELAEVVARLIAIERALAALAPVGRPTPMQVEFLARGTGSARATDYLLGARLGIARTGHLRRLPAGLHVGWVRIQ